MKLFASMWSTQTFPLIMIQVIDIILCDVSSPLFQFKTKMGRNIYRALFKPKENNRNELFLQGRMAYVVDLEDEFADSDVPTTIIRSKADCPSLEVSEIVLKLKDLLYNTL